MSRSSRNRMTSCIATNDVVLGGGSVIPAGERFYIANKVNQRNFAGHGRGKVGVYNRLQSLLEYVSPTVANNLKEAHHAVEQAK